MHVAIVTIMVLLLPLWLCYHYGCVTIMVVLPLRLRVGNQKVAGGSQLVGICKVAGGSQQVGIFKVAGGISGGSGLKPAGGILEGS